MGGTSPAQPYPLPDIPRWCALHQLLTNADLKFVRSGRPTTRTQRLLYEHESVKVRLEYSRWFASHVLERRLNGPAGKEVHRAFEAFLFFARSSVDCEAYFINDICGIGLKERDVDAHTLHQKLRAEPARKELSSLLRPLDESRRPHWFKDLNHLRRIATHRQITPFTRVVESPPPTLKDEFFLRDLVPTGEDEIMEITTPRVGVGAFTVDVCRGLHEFTESCAGTLAEYISQGELDV